METQITREQYEAGLKFMLHNFPCSIERHGDRCEGCEIDFQALLDHMEIARAPAHATDT